MNHRLRFGEIWPKLATAAWDLLFPDTMSCAACDGSLKPSEKYVCASCRAQIIPVTKPTCAKCGHPLTYPGFCQDCRTRQRNFVRAWSAAMYRGVLRQCIHRFKYSHGAYLAPFLGGLLASCLKEAAGLPQKPLVVPVPLDRQRLRERGFNQSQLLAQEVARAYKWPLNNKILTRTRHTLPQAGLSATDRWSNVAGAFIAVNCERLKGKEILLIDDIYTTGSTVDAASKALTKAGAGGVYVATVAIASSHPKARPNKF